MSKYKIQRKDCVRDYTTHNIKFRSNNLLHLSPLSKLDLQQSPIQQKKTEKIIEPPRRRPVVVNFEKQNTLLNDLDIIQGESDTSAQGLRPKTLRKEMQLQRTKSLSDQVNLKNIFTSYRSGNLKRHMFNQLRKNSVFRKPVIFEPFSQNINEDDLWKGFQLPRVILNIAFCIGIAQTFFSCFLTTLLFTFQDNFFQGQFFRYFEIFSLLCLICEIGMGFVRVKEVGSRKLIKIREISMNYLRSNFLFDFLCFLALLICILVSHYHAHYMLALFFLKVPECIKRLVKIETKLFQSFYWEQYWGLMKILLSNFLYAHFIAILILMMSWLDDHQSWLNIKNIAHAPWFQQYAWAYYWGTTVMLTVGFGDLAAANYKEAICLVLIETISCMALAYNINCIGNLLRNLRSNEIQKEKSMKVLKKLCDKNQIGSDLDFKLFNHVKQTYNIETKYNFQEESEFIKKLPVNLREDFLRTANQKILSNLTFIRNFTHRTILALAQKIQMKIAHPDELMCGVNEITKILILKQGEVGLFPSHNLEKYNKIGIDRFIVKQKQCPVLISLDFLQLPMPRKYDIKSVVYSQVYLMDTETMLQILRRKNVDIQFFYSMKDKEKIDLDHFEILRCTNCDSNHTKFRCPRLHYMPIAQQIIFRHMHAIKVHKNTRSSFARLKGKVSALREYRNKETITNSNFNQDESSEKRLASDPDFLREKESMHSIRRGINRFSSLVVNQIAGMSDKERKSLASNLEIKTKMFLSAAELVQKQMIEFLNDRQKQFWSVQVDQAKDYQFYFAKHNPKCLLEVNMKKAPVMARTKTCMSSKSKANLLRKNS